MFPTCTLCGSVMFVAHHLLWAEDWDISGRLPFFSPSLLLPFAFCLGERGDLPLPLSLCQATMICNVIVMEERRELWR